MKFRTLFLKEIKEEPWQIATARFCVESSRKGFKYDELRSFVKEKYPEVSDYHISQFFQEEIQTPSGRNLSRSANGDSLWTPPLDLVSKITDYDELQEARSNAESAFQLSAIAIGISLLAIVVSAFVPWAISEWVTQDVRVENGACFFVASPQP